MRNLSGFMKILFPSALLISGLLYALYIFMGYERGERSYEDLEDAYISVYESEEVSSQGLETEQESELLEGSVQSAPHPAPPLDAPKRKTIDWDGLKDRNKDIIGWIDIPAVEISYPLVQGDDNEFYLHRGIDKEYLFAGCLFLDSACDRELQNYNSIIYGHNMRNGSMFARLKEFLSAETVQKCPYFWIYTPDGDFLFRIVSAHTAAPGSDTFTVRFKDYKSYAAWIEKMGSLSAPDCGAVAVPGDRLVTLSTCTNDSSVRMVMQGKRVWSGAQAEESAQTDS